MADLEIYKGVSATGARSALENFWVATPTSGNVNAFMTTVAARYSVRTLSELNISKQLQA